jgi:hypothetical protein
MKTDLEKEAGRIADAIVELVERRDGPVTLTQVQREISGFANHEPSSLRHVVKHDGRETSFWSEMTEAGLTALLKVTRERRVAIQFVSMLPYLLDGCVIEDDDWQPIVLLPARAANVDSPNWLLRVPQRVKDDMAKQFVDGKAIYRLLTPRHVGATADHFFHVGTGLQQ